MFAKVLDQIGGRLGLPNAWERRTKKAVLDAYDIIAVPRDRPDILTASAHRFEPAVVHAPTGWKIVFPVKRDARRLRWFGMQDGDVMLQAGALREGVWLETRIAGPEGVLGLSEAFERQASGALEKSDAVEDLVRRPPAEGGRPGELSFVFRRNGAPLQARLLMLGVNDHLVEVFYETPLRLATAAAALADETVAIGLDTANPPDWPESTPEEMAEAIRGFGMSEDEIAEALKDGRITQP